MMQKGQRPVYESPAEFFALTYPTYNLRELVKDVCLRLAGQTDKAYRKLSVNYGGGKTHTLITLRHLVHDPDGLPDLAAVREFKAHIDFKPPKARVAALCFDKIDLEKGIETPGPDGAIRMLKHPWSVLAFQLAGVGRPEADPRRWQGRGTGDAASGTTGGGTVVQAPEGGSLDTCAPRRGADVPPRPGRRRPILTRAHDELLPIPYTGGGKGGPVRHGSLAPGIRPQEV